jgi:hypothetical protein
MSDEEKLDEFLRAKARVRRRLSRSISAAIAMEGAPATVAELADIVAALALEAGCPNGESFEKFMSRSYDFARRLKAKAPS